MLHDDWWPKEFGRGYNGDVRTVRAWGVSGMFCETISTETSVYVACCVRRAKSFFFFFFLRAMASTEVGAPVVTVC